ncbi:MAG: ATP-binding protein [Proteobacteria bacterium]|nr:ATP-binding protein [Pseudomonadota bacterium]
MIYPRKLGSRLIRELDSPRITLLTGMRQTGKTTLIRHIFGKVQNENKLFLDLENPLNQSIFEEKNFDNILSNLRELGIDPEKKIFLFLDEIQLAPAITRAVKYLYDHYRVKFFLTGSSSYYLKNLFSESLSGRKIIYELFPLDFEEFLIFKGQEKKFSPTIEKKAKAKNRIAFEKQNKYYDEYLKSGGFPGVVLEKKNKRSVLEDIFRSFFEKDVRTLADFKGIRELRDLIILLANRIGSKLDVSKLAREIGISRETVYSYLGFLEKTYFISLISPFSRSLNGEVRGAKKIYFCDTGLVNLLGKTAEGNIFENAVFLNLRDHGKINFYEKYKGPEIDFILDGKAALEAKIHGDSTDLKKLKRTATGLNLKNYYLITKNYFDHPRAIPAVDL